MFCANAWLALGGMPIFWTLLSTTALLTKCPPNPTGLGTKLWNDQWWMTPAHIPVTRTTKLSPRPNSSHNRLHYSAVLSAIYGKSRVGHEWIHDLDMIHVVSILQPTERRCRRSSSCLWLLCHLLFMLRQYLEAYSHIEARNTIQCTIGSHSHPSQHPPTDPQNFPTDLCLWAQAKFSNL